VTSRSIETGALRRQLTGLRLVEVFNGCNECIRIVIQDEALIWCKFDSSGPDPETAGTIAFRFRFRLGMAATNSQRKTVVTASDLGDLCAN
jgi:hypothetical protein